MLNGKLITVLRTPGAFECGAECAMRATITLLLKPNIPKLWSYLNVLFIRYGTRSAPMLHIISYPISIIIAILKINKLNLSVSFIQDKRIPGTQLHLKQLGRSEDFVRDFRCLLDVAG